MYQEEPGYVTVIKENSRKIKKYFYQYYACADFLNIMGNISSKKFEYFKDINRNVMFNQRLLDKIISNKQTMPKRMQIYQNYFLEKLARFDNGDGTFSFVLPSGKIIPDKFCAFDEKEAMHPEFCNFETVDLKQEVLGTGHAKMVTKKIETINFVNQFGIYLLDQSKIRTINDVFEIVGFNPVYLNQIPARFFKQKNIDTIKDVVKTFYKNYFETKNKDFYYIPFIKNKYEQAEEIIKDKCKLLEKLETKSAGEQQEQEEYTYSRPSQSFEKEKHPKYTEQFKRKTFPTLYKYFDIIDKKYASLMRGKDNLQKLQLRVELYEKKIEIVEKYRDSLCSKRRYVPTNEDPFGKYQDDRNWQQMELSNSKIEQKVSLLDISVIQGLIDKLYGFENKISQSNTIDANQVAMAVQKHLSKTQPQMTWKIDTIYVPDINNISPVLRMDRWVDVAHSSLRYIGVVNNKYPKSLKILSVSDTSTAERILKRIEKQIKLGNVVLICEEHENKCDLSKDISSNEIENCTKLPTVSALGQSSYSHFDGIDRVLYKQILGSLSSKHKKQTDSQKEDLQM